MSIVQRALFLLAGLVAATAAIDCASCDNHSGCTNTFTQHCAGHSHCYTITRNGLVIQKGCALGSHACKEIREATHGGSQCSTCVGDRCNDDRSSIGGGIRVDQYPQQPGYQIGGGVYPRSSAMHTSLASLTSVCALFARYYIF